MAVEDNPPPPSSTDKTIPFSIPNKVPIKLDLEKHNYNSWSSFSLIHFGSLGLKSHVEEETASTNSEWCQLDDLIKMWILGSLCDSLQEQVLTTPGNANKHYGIISKISFMIIKMLGQSTLTMNSARLRVPASLETGMVKSSTDHLKFELVLSSSKLKHQRSNVLSYAGIWSDSSGPSHVRPVHTQPLNQTVLYQPCLTITAGPIAILTQPCSNQLIRPTPQPHYLAASSSASPSRHSQSIISNL
ncbi:hypothetical protein Tco_1278457 [Tanacetum coccineum]